MNTRELNRELTAGRDAAGALEGKLASAYEAAFRAAGRAASDAFLNLSQPRTAAADPEHPWSKPEPGELVDDKALAADMEARTRATRKQMLAAIAGEMTVGFDVTSPFAEQLIDRLRFQQNRAVEIRERVADAVDQGYSEGLSVADTAKLIRETVFEIAPARAATLARTDLNGIGNGASHLAAKAAQVGGYKRWLTAGDARVRDDHYDVDGQTVPIDEPFQVCGTTMQYPGDPLGPDECVYGCRCTILMVDAKDVKLESNVPVVASGDELADLIARHKDGVLVVRAPEDLLDQIRAIPLTAAAGPDVAQLAMVAVYPTAEEQKAIAVDGGQDPATLHTTMVFLGDVADLDLEAAARAVERVAGDTETMGGRVGGVGMFGKTPDGYPQIALPNVKGLAALRAALVDALDEEGVVSPSEHDWVPHMTLQYMPEPSLPDLAVIGSPLTFASVALVVADERTDYELTGGTMREPATASAVTITVDNDTPVEGNADAPMPADVSLAWVSDIAFEGAATADGRYILPDAIEWREPPLTLMALVKTGPGGHEDAEAAGRMDAFMKDAAFDMAGERLPDGVVAARAAGIFDSGEYGVYVARMVDEQIVRGVSVDLAPPQAGEWCFRDPETGELFDPDTMNEAEWERAFFGELQYAFKKALIMGATVCPMPAFDFARIARTASGEMEATTLWAPIQIVKTVPEPVTASAAGKVPNRPPAAWFDIPETDYPCPLTVDDEGRVFGHIADWSSCHVGLPGCATPPRSASEYAYFHTGEIETDEGVRIAVGKLMLGSPHAQVRDSGGRVVGAAEASKHYDDNAFVGAYVRAHDGAHGIWACGTLSPDLPDDRIRELEVNPPSGDWRPINGALEMIAALAVPVPGHPIPRNQVAITASGDDIHVDALIAFGMDPAEADEAAADRQIRVLAARAEGGIDALAEMALQT